MPWGGASFRSCDSLLSRLEQRDPTLQELVILPTKSFGDPELNRICRVLEEEEENDQQQQPRKLALHSLSASGHAVSPECLLRLGKAIAKRKGSASNAVATTTNTNSSSFTLKVLAVGHSEMGDKGVVALCNGLSTTYTNTNTTSGGNTNDDATGCCRLEKIDLSYKGMTAIGFETILQTLGRNESLRYLNLSRNSGIASFRSSHICDEPGPNIVVVSLSSTSPSFCMTNMFPNLIDLDLSDCGLTADFCRSLFPALVPETTANLSASTTSSSSPSASASSSLRRTLRLSLNPAMGDAGFQAILAVLPWIEALYVKDCGLTDTSMHHLLKVSTLKSEQLHATDTSQGCIKMLDFSNNRISSKGAELLAQFIASSSIPFEKSNNTAIVNSNKCETPDLPFNMLTELNLSGNPLGEGGVIEIVKALERLRRMSTKGEASMHTLDLSSTDCGVTGAVQAVQKSFVHTLRLAGNKLSGSGFQNLADSCFAPAAAAGFAPLPYCLDLACNQADAESVVYLLKAFLPETDDNSTAPKQLRLRTLVLGGNATSAGVEDAISRLIKVYPELDVARDKIRKTN